MKKVIDSLTFYGIKLYSYVKDLKLDFDDFIIEKIILNPLYKYACQCCSDGFYQQYLWSKERNYVLRLGIYNPKCRIPPQIEIGRQYDHEIHGIVLHPQHHGFSLLDKKLEYIYQFAEDHDLPLVVHKPNIKELEKVLQYNVILILVDTEVKIESNRVYYITKSPSINKEIYGSGSPYNGKDLIEVLRENKERYNKELFYDLPKKLFDKN